MGGFFVFHFFFPFPCLCSLVHLSWSSGNVEPGFVQLLSPSSSRCSSVGCCIPMGSAGGEIDLIWSSRKLLFQIRN